MNRSDQNCSELIVFYRSVPYRIVMIFEKSKLGHDRVWVPVTVQRALNVKNGECIYWKEIMHEGRPMIVVLAEKDVLKPPSPEPTFAGQYPRFLNQ